MGAISIEDVSSRGTSTHQSGESAREVVLITVPSKAIGTNRSTPPNPYDFEFAHELRATYFHDGEKTGVQFPRWSNEYTQVEFRAPLSDVVVVNDSVVGVYRQEEDSALLVVWNVAEDEWEVTTEEIDDYSEYIESTGDVVWSAVRSREVAHA